MEPSLTTDMSNPLLSRIESRLAALKLSENEASSLTGMGRGLITDLKRRAVKNPSFSVRSETLAKLADALQTTVSYLLAHTDDPTLFRLPKPVPILDDATIIYACNECGMARKPFAIPGNHDLSAKRVVVPTIHVGTQSFAFVVTDDAMRDEERGLTLRVDDLVIVDPAIEATPLDAVLAIVDGAVLLRSYAERGEAPAHVERLLHPLNRKFFKTIVMPASATIIGVVVEHRRSFVPKRHIVARS